MTEYTAQCRHDADEYIRAYDNGISVVLDGYADGEKVTAPYLSPDDARTFARGILALADEIDGDEVEAAGVRVMVGDRVMIVRGEYSDSNGSVGLVNEVDDSHIPYRIVDTRGDFVAWAREVRKLDEPAGLLDEEGLADWERDLLTKPSPEPSPSPFARYVEEAKRLLSGTDHTGTDVIVLARELHEQS